VDFAALRKAIRFAFGEGGSVKTRVVRSGMWVGASGLILALLNMVRSVFLARLLSPEIFGLMGLASIALRTFETFTRPGLAQALIARQQEFSEAAPTAFTMLVVRGIVLAALMAAVAPWVADFYGEQKLAPMLTALASVFVIGSLVNINTIAQQRNLDFRRLTYLAQVTSLSGVVVTVGMAFWLRSVWALVIGQVAVTAVNVLLSYRFVPGRVRFGFNSGIARDLFRYGKFVTASSIVLYVATELDSAVIGKILGTEQLGYYALALTIANLVTTNLSKIASSIMMPAYARLQSEPVALRNAYLRTMGLMLLAVMPATAGLLILARPFIGIVYGNQWVSAALPLQILAVFGLFRAMAAFSGYLFEGMGVPKVAFQLGVLRLVVIVPVIVPMIRLFGLAGAAMTVTAGIAVQWLGGLVFLRRLVGIGLDQLIRVIWRPLWTTLVMSAAVFVCNLLIDPRSVLGLVLAIGAGVVVYSALNLPTLLALRRERLG
jgi:O-antigen/teichoic acid export membrane protein